MTKLSIVLLALVAAPGCDAVVGDPAGDPSGGSDSTEGSDPTEGSTASPSSSTGDAPMGETGQDSGSAESSGGSAETGGGTDGTDGSDGSDGSGGSGTAFEYPQCLVPLLDPELDMLGPACTEILIIEYEFQGESVWVFDSSDCGFFDQFFPVYDANCTVTCLLYGIGGNTVCDGVEFYETAVEVQSWPYPE